mmetsp:Transcript_31578/g.78689  ORF Transcript_31578/g.78689 Transcript_31578/m.78689 type:complete len:215 (+) Transcript_31578:1034-1678(+)
MARMAPSSIVLIVVRSLRSASGVTLSPADAPLAYVPSSSSSSTETPRGSIGAPTPLLEMTSDRSFPAKCSTKMHGYATPPTWPLVSAAISAASPIQCLLPESFLSLPCSNSQRSCIRSHTSSSYPSPRQSVFKWRILTATEPVLFVNAFARRSASSVSFSKFELSTLITSKQLPCFPRSASVPSEAIISSSPSCSASRYSKTIGASSCCARPLS